MRRRRLEDDRRRRLLGERLRRLLHDVRGRRACRRALGPERDLRRHGRDDDSRQRLARRRRLQVRRWRPHLDATSGWRTRATSAGIASTRTNPDLVYVAALGHAWGPNAERGVFRSRDGGATWEQVLFKSEQRRAPSTCRWTRTTRASSTPRSGRRSATRTRWSAAAPAVGLWRSTDGGDTWTDISRATRGCRKRHPRQDRRRGLARPQPGRVWAIVEAGQDGARLPLRRRRRDLAARERRARICAGAPGTTCTSSPTRSDRRDRLDPEPALLEVDRRRQDLHRGPDAARRQPRPLDRPARPEPHDRGQRRRRLRHLQRRALVVVHSTTSRRRSSTTSPPTTSVPYHVYGSQQDNTAMRLPSQSTSRAPSPGRTGVEPGGGESGYIAIEPQAADIVFGGGIGSRAGARSPDRLEPPTRGRSAIIIGRGRRASARLGSAPSTLKYRFQWTFPIELSPHDPRRALHRSAISVHRSTDEGTSWEVISPDLTRNDPERARAPPAARSPGTTPAPRSTARSSPSPSRRTNAASSGPAPTMAWSTSRATAARTWQNVTPPDLPEWALISIIEPSPHDPATAYVAATRYKLDDSAPVSLQDERLRRDLDEDHGQPPGRRFTRVIREDPKPARAALLRDRRLASTSRSTTA